MANNYEQIMALVNAGNKMGLSNTITRDNGIPLDLSSVYSSYNEAVVYAATKAIAYHGQPIAVITETDATLYVITPVSQGKAVIDEIEYDIYLKQVGAKTLGDEKSITLDEDGVLSLAGFKTAAGATLPQKQADGTIKWVSIDAIVEGDGNTKTVVASNDTQITVTPSHDEESDTYTYTLGLNVDFSNYLNKTQVEEAIATALQAAKDYADENDANTVYDDKDLQDRVKAIEDDYLKAADRYNDTAIKGRVDALEDVVGDAEDGLVKDVADNASAIADLYEVYQDADEVVLGSAKDYTNEEISGLTVAIENKNNVECIVIKNKAGNEVASVDASKFVQDSFLNDVAYDAATGKVSFTWIMGDGSNKTDEIDIAHLVDTYTAGNGLTLGENNEFSVDTAVIATVEALNAVSAVAEAAQTAEEVASAIDTKIEEANLGQYAIKATVEEALAGKVAASEYAVDKATFAIASEVENTLKDYAKTTDVNTTLVDYIKSSEVAAEYATKEALTNGLSAKVDSGSIAHTSEGVAEGVTRVGTELKIVVDSYTKEETRNYVAGVIEDMTGGESAADVLLALNNYKDSNDSRVAVIEAEQTTQNNSITALQTAVSSAQTSADGAKTAADDAAAAVTALANGQVATNKTDIAAVVTRLETVETASGTNTTNIATLTGKVTALEAADVTINETIGSIQGSITSLTNKDAELVGLINAKANAEDVYTKGEADKAIEDAIKAIPATDLSAYAKTADVNAALDLKANAADVYTKTEADAAFMTQDEVDTRINALIAASDPDGDGNTIKNIQNLVEYVENNAGEISALVTATNANTDKLAGITTTVTAYVAEQLETITQPKASDEISVAEDGTLGINEVNIDKLVQSANSLLILNGGTAADL